MKKIWTNKWKSLLVWMSGYLNFIAFALVGGYVIVKSEDEGLQKTTKTAFIVTMIFTALSAFLTLFNYIAGSSDNYYTSDAYEFYGTFSMLVGIAKIIVYTIFIVMTLIKKEDSTETEDDSKL